MRAATKPLRYSAERIQPGGPQADFFDLKGRVELLLGGLHYTDDGGELKTFASGLRNSVFLTSHPVTGHIWATEMGREAFSVGTGWFRLGFAPTSGQRGQLSYTRQNGGEVLYPYLQMDALYDNADRLTATYQAGWLRKDMSPKPVYEKLQGLIKGRWWSKHESSTDAQGKLSARLYFGDYQAVITLPSGAKFKRTIAWPRQSARSPVITV